ncbi:unnamed protein product [Pleuronectes platessa]|uniref:Uncharacterized protein n=1 Tax=Pleuronectes platessa TaxID=8262 RepID=A0A9N7VUX3_PLEPL|nr:unnamed protein product [Pleuronectes platessa]
MIIHTCSITADRPLQLLSVQPCSLLVLAWFMNMFLVKSVQKPLEGQRTCFLRRRRRRRPKVKLFIPTIDQTAAVRRKLSNFQISVSQVINKTNARSRADPTLDELQRWECSVVLSEIPETCALHLPRPPEPRPLLLQVVCPRDVHTVPLHRPPPELDQIIRVFELGLNLWRSESTWVTAAGANLIGCLPKTAMTLTSQQMDDSLETGGSCSFSLIGSRSLTRCFYRSVQVLLGGDSAIQWWSRSEDALWRLFFWSSLRPRPSQRAPEEPERRCRSFYLLKAPGLWGSCLVLELSAGACWCQSAGREQRFIRVEEGKPVRENLEHHGSSAVDEEAHESGGDALHAELR